MHSLVPLLLLAASACARPPGPTQAADELAMGGEPQRLRGLSDELLGEYYLPRILVPQYGYEEQLPMPVKVDTTWLDKEIERIARMQEVVSASIQSYEKELTHMILDDPFLMKVFRNKIVEAEREDRLNYGDRLPSASSLTAPDIQDEEVRQYYDKNESPRNADQKRNNFALTPTDKGYFDPDTTSSEKLAPNKWTGHHEGGDMSASQMGPPRQIRQNPNLSKTKNLISEQLDRLRNGLSSDDSGTTEKPRSIRFLDTTAVDPADSIYSVAVIAGVCTALTLAIVAFAFGWYTMSKRAKAAADVDYPAYGVTGPQADMSGDRKLAHSAHMYHYQHQKQQIIAMERNGLEQRNGSVSDPESEEENEEGDYTVYECPGFATTGDMEVKNPLFNEEPTPATPAKCVVLKPKAEE